MEMIRKYIQSFIGDPPDTDFQLGYLFCAIDLYRELGGEDYSDLGHHYTKRLTE
jgi:hypothetical protein